MKHRLLVCALNLSGGVENELIIESTPHKECLTNSPSPNQTSTNVSLPLFAEAQINGLTETG